MWLPTHTKVQTMFSLRQNFTKLAFGLTAIALLAQAAAADPAREAEVAAKGAQVMPFSLAATTHVFTKTAQGGLQQVIAKNPGDQQQIALIRQHLQEIAEQFGKGDFTGPKHIHGAAMPGLATLAKARPGEIRIHYSALVDGGQIEYLSANKGMVTALHQWFDAQLSDHGADAKAGHGQHGMPSQ